MIKATHINEVQPVKVMQFICPTGYYGAERWITALAGNTDRKNVTQSLVVTDEFQGAEHELCVAFKKLGLSVHLIKMAHKFDLRAILRLRDILKKESIEVLHTHGYKSDIIGLIAAKLAGVKCICTPHGFENTKDLKLRLFIALGNASFRFFDFVVPLSETLCNDVAKTGVLAARIKYIANGVDLKDIDNRQLVRRVARGKNSGAMITFGFIGQLISRKNIDHIIDVFEALSADDEALRLLLIGDGEQKACLESQVEKSTCKDKIEFRGFVPDAIPYYYDIDVFLMTSSLEGIPRCLMEAMSTGVPVIAYDIPGVDQLVSDNHTGLLAPFGDKTQLTSLCKRLLNEPDLSSRLVTAARAHIEENHSASRMASEYSALYRELLSSR